MRVFPNGFGFAALLVLAIYSAWEWPEIAHGFNDWAGGFLSKFVLLILFFLQGLKMEKKKLFGAFENPLKLLAVQVGIIICPLLIVLIAYSLGFFEAGWLDAFILLAFLPTTISSSVVYTRYAHGDADFALGQSTISNLISPFVVLLVWGCLEEEKLQLTETGGMELVAVVFPKVFLLTLLPCFLGWWLSHHPSVQKGVRSNGGSYLKFFPSVGISCLVFFSMGQVISMEGRETCLESADELLFPLVAGWIILVFLSLVWSRCVERPFERRVAILFCLSQKSLAMGLPMLQILSDGSNASFSYWLIPLVLFHFIQLLLGIPLIGFHRKFV